MRKKFFFMMSIMVLMSSMAFTQTYKGNWIVSGNSSLQITSSKPEGGESTTTVLVNPGIGYFMADGLAVGANMNLLSSSGSTLFTFMPTAAYYFNTASQVKPFVQLGIGYSNLKVNNSSYGGLAIGGGAGLVYLLNNRLGVNLGLQYIRNDYDSAVTNTIGGLLGFSIFF